MVYWVGVSRTGEESNDMRRRGLTDFPQEQIACSLMSAKTVERVSEARRRLDSCNGNDAPMSLPTKSAPEIARKGGKSGTFLSRRAMIKASGVMALFFSTRQRVHALESVVTLKSFVPFEKFSTVPDASHF